MRAFVAIDLPGPVREVLAERQQSLRQACRSGRWTRPEGIHLTLKFLGEISEAQTEQTIQALERVGGFAPILIELKGYGFFPSVHRARVFWAGVGASAALEEFAGRIEAELERAGFARERRPFAPHLTLARFAEPHSQLALEAAAARAPSALAKFEASEFFLFESKLSPQGAEYRKVRRFPRGSDVAG